MTAVRQTTRIHPPGGEESLARRQRRWRRGGPASASAAGQRLPLFCSPGSCGS